MNRKIHHLAKMIAAYQQKHDVEAKDMAKEIGISESSLCRIRQGKKPDADGLWKIVAWQLAQ
jgi:DNA-binding Xre family transcriptional regulator